MSDPCATDPTPEDDYAIAREALLQGDHAHALHHLAGALAGDPNRPEWLLLLDQIVADADDALGLVPFEKGIWFGRAALRARLLAAAGRVPEALDLLLRVAAASPTPPYLRWGLEWLASEETARSVSALDAATALRIFVSAFVKEACPLPARDPRRASVEHAAAIAARLRAVHPDSAELCQVHSQLLRRVGRVSDAIEAARRGHALGPTWSSASLLATALREDNRIDDAIAAFREAAALDPADLSATLDVGDLQLQAGRFAEAAATYASVLAREPHHPWAEPSHAFASLRVGAPARAHGILTRMASALGRPRTDWMTTLQKLAEHNARAVELLASLAPREPYVDVLPGSLDATMNIARKLVADHRQRVAAGEDRAGDPEKPWSVRVTVSGLEAPSVRLAFALQLRLSGIHARLEYGVQRLQEPDPRLPRRPVRHLLWRYEETEPYPVPSPPDEAVCDAVCTLADEPFQIDAWSRAAAGAAARLGEAGVPGLLGAMVHPLPPRGPSVPADEWIERCQVAAALIVARLPGPWAGSLRREVLLDLLDGPHDWTIGAAALALGDVGRREPDARSEVELALHARLLAVPRGGYVGWDHPLVCAYLRLPDLAPELTRELRRIREEVETDD